MPKNLTTIVGFTWLAAVSVAIAVRAVEPATAAPAAALSSSATFDRLTVRRIDVVEPNGKPRVTLSNSDEYPGSYFGGKEYPHPGRERTGGLLFFDDEGSEAGGIGYAGKTEKGEASAGAVITIDQHDQNETMKLAYHEGDGDREAGLLVYGDHPEAGLEPVAIANTEMLAAKTDGDKARAKAKLDKLIETNVGKSSNRAFIGRHNDDAMVVLSDKAGKKRIVMEVGGDGEPSIQFFDETGKLSKRYDGH